MIEISKKIQVINKVVGPQKIIANQTYRLIKYAFVQTVADGVLIYNNLTKGMVFLTKYEYDHIMDIPELISEWYLVPQDFDDKNFCNQVKKLNKIITGKPQGIIKYTIFTTTDCNARCFYCYEKGIEKINMPHKVSVDVANYIIKHSKHQKVKITWFGGEPLYNMDAIDTICTILKDNNIEFSSGMISNSYLFDDDVVAKATDLWHLKSVQITLDGTEKIYNKTKAYIYRDTNAFGRVFDNIRKILDAGITIHIRLNITSKNSDDLNRLVEKINKELGVHEKLILYVHTLFKSTGLKLDEENPSLIFELQKKLERKIFDYGYNANARIAKRIRRNACMADNDSAITILPMGQIGKCEHYSDSDYCGSIYSDKFDKSVIAKFKEAYPENFKCDDCKLYPDCFRLKVCGNDEVCIEELRLHGINLTYTLMENTYNQYKKENINIINKEENDEIEIQC